MSPEAVRRFFELRAIAHKHGLRLFLAKSSSHQRKGFAWLDSGPGSPTITWFDDLVDVEENLSALAEVPK